MRIVERVWRWSNCGSIVEQIHFEAMRPIDLDFEMEGFRKVKMLYLLEEKCIFSYS